MRSIVLALVIGFSLASSAQAVSWVPGNGRSCDVACNSIGQNPAIAGFYTGHHGGGNGKPYFICVGSVEGWRPGYNLREN